jgi:sugar phosphate isomerase/epimerase
MTDTRLSRRGFVKQAAGAAAGVTSTFKNLTAAPFTHELGFQLYTLREILPARAAEAFGALAKCGYKGVEVLRDGLDRYGPMLKQVGISPVSGHFDAPLITGNWDVWAKDPNYKAPPKGYDWAAAISDAKTMGLKYMVLPYLAPGERGSLESFRKIADRMNKAGEECKAAGIRFCYHHHSFEFQALEGARPLDLLMERCDKNLVGLEMDVFWVSVAGADPETLLKTYAGRVPLMHLKDKAKGTALNYSERTVPHEAFREVGSGVLNVQGILRTAAATGVQEYFVEQDYCSGDPVASLTRSYRYLRNLNLSV